ncbi:hypothetical protein IFR05_005909 [Cadophora sp. M221]|nr:hypothetical protein IFR05_005909 [Cadophora sp. M221]
MIWAIDLLGQYINPKVNSLPQDKTADVDSLDHCFLNDFYDNNQDDLHSLLQDSKGLPRSAYPLVCLLIPRIPSPSLDLIETIVYIFCKANRLKEALNYLTVQIKASEQRQQNCNSFSNEPSSMSLCSRKLHVAREYYYHSTRHITALQALLPILENRFGIMDIQTLKVKRELSLVMYDRGDKEQARLLHKGAVMILEEKKEVRKDQGKEKDGGSDKGSCLQVKDHGIMMKVKGTLREWDKRLIEREELDKKRPALFGSREYYRSLK